MTRADFTRTRVTVSSDTRQSNSIPTKFLLGAPKEVLTSINTCYICHTIISLIFHTNLIKHCDADERRKLSCSPYLDGGVLELLNGQKTIRTLHHRNCGIRGRQATLPLSSWIHGLRPRKLYVSVAVTSAPVRVSTQRPLVPSFTSVVG